MVPALGSGGLGVVEVLAGAEEKPNAFGAVVSVAVVPANLNPVNPGGFCSDGLSVCWEENGDNLAWSEDVGWEVAVVAASVVGGVGLPSPKEEIGFESVVDDWVGAPS